jgi:hypothetical protein
MAIVLDGTAGITTPDLTDTSLTSGRVVYAGTSGNLTGSSAFTFDGTTATTPRLALGGTTLPAAGTATLFSRSSDNNTYLQSGSGNGINFLDGSQNTMLTLAPTNLVFQISNAEQMRLTSTGLGIGTSSPSCLLDVQKAAGANFVATFQNTTAATPYGVFIKDAASSTAGYPLFAVTNSTGVSTYLRVDSSNGNVGIGTAPSATTKLSIVNTNATYSLTQNIFNASAGNLWIGQAPAATYFSVDNFAMAFCTGSNGGVAGTSVPTNERFRIAANGAFGLSGANYGNAGEVLTSGGSSAAPSWTTPASGGGSFTAKTTNYTAASGDNILANTSSGSWTLTLPASPSTGNAVQVMDSIGTFDVYPLTVARNGSTIMSAAEDMIMSVEGAATTFVYNGSTWRVI